MSIASSSLLEPGTVALRTLVSIWMPGATSALASRLSRFSLRDPFRLEVCPVFAVARRFVLRHEPCHPRGDRRDRSHMASRVARRPAIPCTKRDRLVCSLDGRTAGYGPRCGACAPSGLRRLAAQTLAPGCRRRTGRCDGNDRRRDWFRVSRGRRSDSVERFGRCHSPHSCDGTGPVSYTHLTLPTSDLV